MILQEKSKSCTPYGCSPLTGGSNIQLNGEWNSPFSKCVNPRFTCRVQDNSFSSVPPRGFFYSLIRLDTRETVIYSQIWVCCGGLHLALWLLPALMRKFRSRPVTAFQLRASTTFTTVLSRQHWAVPLITASLSAPDCNSFNHVKHGESKEGTDRQVTFPSGCRLTAFSSRWWRVVRGKLKTARSQWDRENGWFSRRNVAGLG